MKEDEFKKEELEREFGIISEQSQTPQGNAKMYEQKNDYYNLMKIALIVFVIFCATSIYFMYQEYKEEEPNFNCPDIKIPECPDMNCPSIPNTSVQNFTCPHCICDCPTEFDINLN